MAPGDSTDFTGAFFDPPAVSPPWPPTQETSPRTPQSPSESFLLASGDRHRRRHGLAIRAFPPQVPPHRRRGRCILWGALIATGT